jgi:hypothetical protein
MYTQVRLANLDAGRRRAMVALALSCCPSLDAAAYLSERLAHYEYALVAEKEGELLAFELVEEFEERDERHVYLGPLFSRRAACVPMFIGFVESIAKATRGAFHFVAEVQNPHIALVLKRLFWRSSFPRLDSSEVPAAARAVASRFAARLPHMGSIDLRALSSRGGPTLFRPSPAHEPIVRWMRRRGVDLASGHSQLFVMSYDGSSGSREALARELAVGAAALADWPHCKRDMLRRFEATAHRMEDSKDGRNSLCADS